MTFIRIKMHGRLDGCWMFLIITMLSSILHQAFCVQQDNSNINNIRGDLPTHGKDQNTLPPTSPKPKSRRFYHQDDVINYLPCLVSAGIFTAIGFVFPCVCLCVSRLSRHAMRTVAPANIVVENIDDTLYALDKVSTKGVLYAHKNCSCAMFLACLLVPSFLCALVFGAGTWLLCQSILGTNK